MTLGIWFPEAFHPFLILFKTEQGEQRESPMEGRCLISSPFSFSSDNRAPSVTGDTNKENVPSSSSSGSVGEDMSSRVDSQEGQRSHTERTPKPRKPKKIPTLIQLSENTAAHAVSHTLYSPSLFIFMSVTFSLLLYYYNYYY